MQIFFYLKNHMSLKLKKKVNFILGKKSMLKKVLYFFFLLNLP